MMIDGYHGTSSDNKQSIISLGLDPDKVKVRFDHWLGQGVYFFDDIDKAKWWSRSIAAKKSKGAVVFKSKIRERRNKVLDLDQVEDLDAFLTECINLIHETENLKLDKVPIFTDQNVRAFWFDYYKRTHDITVIIATFNKPYAGYTFRRSKDDRIVQMRFLKTLGLGFSERQICVSEKSVIHDTHIVYDDSEEVI